MEENICSTKQSLKKNDDKKEYNNSCPILTHMHRFKKIKLVVKSYGHSSLKSDQVWRNLFIKKGCSFKKVIKVKRPLLSDDFAKIV